MRSVSRHHNKHRHDSSAPSISPTTGPLQVLRGRKLLVLVDDENLRYSARDHGLKLSYTTLAQTLQRISRDCSLHTFFSRSGGDKRRSKYFDLAGWTVHVNNIESVHAARGTKHPANCDNFLLFTSGILASRSQADTIVLASGDGDLVCALAQAICELPKKRTVVTMSIAGSTSQRLNAAHNPHIAANIELGMDMMHRNSNRRYQ
jgi:hypothetical protein